MAWRATVNLMIATNSITVVMINSTTIVTGGIIDSTYRSLAQQRLKLINGLHHIGGEGGMRLQEIGPTIRQGTVEIGVHRNDIRTYGIFNVVLLPSEWRLGINAPFLMEKCVWEEFNSGKRGSTVGLGMYRLAKDHLSQYS